ncbi:lytic transglycosylase domain-containing protein [Paenibacillus sp. GYB003]|uniref:lytic transglycosylase domain-containing protein n=1 Tax=Paenibacillus sp. GYB003 TaxID=2994392 RepID=UPI002F96AC5C
MSIDPRLMSQLLRLRFQSGDPLSPRGGGEDAGDFSALLETLLAGGNAGSGAKTASAIAAVGAGGSGLPPPVYGANGVLHGLQRTGRSTPKTQTGPYDPLVEQASERHGVEPELIKAVIHSESSFDRTAVSSAGAKGLMQLMDRTSADLGVSDPFDAAQNIEGGTRYLAGLLRKYGGSEAVALAAYNAGPGRIDRLGIRSDADLREKLHLLPVETQQYIRNVLERKRLYQ